MVHHVSGPLTFQSAKHPLVRKHVCGRKACTARVFSLLETGNRQLNDAATNKYVEGLLPHSAADPGELDKTRPFPIADRPTTRLEGWEKDRRSTIYVPKPQNMKKLVGEKAFHFLGVRSNSESPNRVNIDHHIPGSRPARIVRH